MSIYTLYLRIVKTKYEAYQKLNSNNKLSFNIVIYEYSRIVVLYFFISFPRFIFALKSRLTRSQETKLILILSTMKPNTLNTTKRVANL